MKALAALLVACGALGCGARTALPELDAAAPPPTPPENACASAVEVGATTPMRGYCATEAHLAPYAIPTAPATRWLTALPTDLEPIQLVVDAAGRTWASIDPVRGDDALTPSSLVIVDARGTIVGMHDFRPDTIGNLYLGRDGDLRATVGVSPRRVMRIDSHGTPTMLGALPMPSWRTVVASDGTLIVQRVDFHAPDFLSRVAEDGTVLWSSAPLPCASCINDVALWPDDRIVLATEQLVPGSMSDWTTTVHALGADGSATWERALDGIVTEGPVIASDGSVRIVVGVTDAAGATTTIVTALSERGDVMWQTRLAEDYEQTWDDALPVAPDGTVFVRTFHALIAVGPDGAVRWRNDAPTNLAYDAVVDTHGTLVVMEGPFTGLDTATGAERWHVDGPGPDGGTWFFVSNLALAPHCLIGASFGGTLFAACDP